MHAPTADPRPADWARIEWSQSEAGRTDALRQLAAGTAHHVNNLFQIVLGYAEVARSRPEGDPAIASDLAAIAAAGQRATELTGRLAELALSGHRATTPIDVGAAVAQIIDELRPALLECGIGVAVDVRATSSVSIDPARLATVITALVDNARAAMTGGVLRAIVEPAEAGADESVAIVVDDSGHGIEPAALARVFEPFFTTRAGHTGLGLTAAGCIVHAAGGRLSLASAPGWGSTAEVVLPAAARTPVGPTWPTFPDRVAPRVQAAMSATVAASTRTRSSGATPRSRPRRPPET